MPTLFEINVFRFDENAIIPQEFKQILNKLKAIEILEIILRAKLEAAPSIRSRLFFLESRTGSGKSTLMISWLFKKFGKLICSEPRIVLTTANATDVIRYNEDMKYGKNVSIMTSAVKIYCTEKNTCTYCTIQILADMLFKMMRERKIMYGFKLVIIDETHVLDLPTISLVSAVKQFLKIFGNDRFCPLFIFTSATIDIPAFVSFFFGDSAADIYKDPTMIAYVLGAANHEIKEIYLDPFKLAEEMKNAKRQPRNDNPREIRTNNDQPPKNYEECETVARYIAGAVENFDESKPIQKPGDVLAFVPLKSMLLKISNFLASFVKPSFLVTSDNNMADLLFWRKTEKNKRRFLVIPYARDFSKLADDLIESAIERDEESRKNEIKIIISTPVLETGKTFANLAICLDLGLQTSPIYNPFTFKHNKLEIIRQIPANKKQIIQRLGRIGRERPGVFVHFYTQNIFNKLQENEFPATINNYICSDLLLYTMAARHKIGDIFDLINLNDFMYPISLDIMLRSVHDLIKIGIFSPFGEYLVNDVDKLTIYAEYFFYCRKMPLFEALLFVNLEIFNLPEEISAVFSSDVITEKPKIDFKKYNSATIQSAIKNARNTLTQIQRGKHSIKYIKNRIW